MKQLYLFAKKMLTRFASPPVNEAKFDELESKHGSWGRDIKVSFYDAFKEDCFRGENEQSGSGFGTISRKMSLTQGVIFFRKSRCNFH